MEKDFAAISDIVDRMLMMVEPAGYSIERTARSSTVRIAELECLFGDERPDLSNELGKLGLAIEARIAFERASAMLKAAHDPDEPLPLWLASGPAMLAHWIQWSRTENALRRELELFDAVLAAPVAGGLERRARRGLGQGGAQIVVRFGRASAKRIELADKPRIIAKLGDTSQIIVSRQNLPERDILAMNDGSLSPNERLRLANVINHPFFDAADFPIVRARNWGVDLMLEVETVQQPLQPVPAAARAVVPRDADPTALWSATISETRALNALIAEGRRHGTG